MEVHVPDLGDFSDVEVIEVIANAGDQIAAEDPLIVLETEKASMEVPSPVAGVVKGMRVGVGDRVSTGDVIADVESDTTEAATAPDAEDEDAPREPEAAVAPEVEPPPRTSAGSATFAAPAHSPRAASPSPRSAAPRINEAGFATAHASPSVRKLARELGVDLTKVAGTGHKGRITADNLKNFVKQALREGGGSALPAVVSVDYAAFGPIDVEALTRIQKISGPRLHASWLNVPHVTQHDEADITALEERRQALKESTAAGGVRLTPLAFIVRACVLAIDEYPTFASSLSGDGENLVLKRYRHIGFAADTPNGLVVPVIRDADRLDVAGIARELADLSERAREGKLGREEMQGGVFTISSLGGIGGTAFTPIINAPEVAILGVSRSRRQPVYVDGELQPRLMLPLSLSYDHRVIDGALAVRFTTYLAKLLGDVERLVDDVS